MLSYHICSQVLLPMWPYTILYSKLYTHQNLWRRTMFVIDVSLFVSYISIKYAVMNIQISTLRDTTLARKLSSSVRLFCHSLPRVLQTSKTQKLNSFFCARLSMLRFTIHTSHIAYQVTSLDLLKTATSQPDASLLNTIGSPIIQICSHL